MLPPAGSCSRPGQEKMSATTAPAGFYFAISAYAEPPNPPTAADGCTFSKVFSFPFESPSSCLGWMTEPLSRPCSVTLGSAHIFSRYAWTEHQKAESPSKNPSSAGPIVGPTEKDFLPWLDFIGLGFFVDRCLVVVLASALDLRDGFGKFVEVKMTHA